MHCNRHELKLKDNGHRLLMPEATHSITKQNAENIFRWIKTSKLPNGYASNISNCVNNDYNVGGLKSRDCHALLERVCLLTFMI